MDRDDLVSARIKFAELFPAAVGSAVVLVTAPPVGNGSTPHEATHHLTKPATGRIVSDVLDSAVAET
ncbi:hypothetical protein ACFXNW_09005 [Nocardia sp. NPDC059180]|uniref:hypothetical protein n=1 Tax=Nocardia sp. NPDC059180 TaxID=3346761 RepID=UPI0036749A02